MRVRAVGILIENDRVALIERHRSGRHYFTFPGGGVDAGETPERAVVREMEEETGLRVVVLRRVGEAWFRSNRQEYFLVQTIGGVFGTGTGEEYQAAPPEKIRFFGTYHPLWMPVTELLDHNVLPVEVAGMVLHFSRAGWPSEPFEIREAVA